MKSLLSILIVLLILSTYFTASQAIDNEQVDYQRLEALVSALVELQDSKELEDCYTQRYSCSEFAQRYQQEVLEPFLDKDDVGSAASAFLMSERVWCSPENPGKMIDNPDFYIRKCKESLPSTIKNLRSIAETFKAYNLKK